MDGGEGRRPVADLREDNLLRDSTTFVHGNGMSDKELRMLADAGSSLSVSPDVELKMGFGSPMTGRASVGGDMYSAMRTAFAAQRGLDGGLRSRDLLEFATVDAARSCGLDARTGSITPGKDAGIVLLRADGRVAKREGALVDVDLAALRARRPASRDRIVAAAGIRLDGTWHPQPRS
ncbi:amidohydrolase family protein [Streptomyces sp. NPDC089424]|uniref:amidohydrolase family protein n=1 Tax=Streptomyces sp. NPDC089424 TaxID=3365917 RepID=UPI0038270EBA